MIQFFRESNGDYLAIDIGTTASYRSNFGKDYFEGRATAIARHVGSVCTTSISRQFLRDKCKPVSKAQVPARWRKAIGF